MAEERKLNALIAAAQSSGVSFDLLELFSRGLDDSALYIFCGNVSKLPQYMKSNETPKELRSFIALGMEMRKSPLSY